MKERISALMDGQLDDQECEDCLLRLKNETELREAWNVYHLIGDSLRGHSAGALPASFNDRLHAEPTVLAPRRSRSSLRRPVRIALSAAASVAAIGFVSWVSMPFLSPEPAQVVQVSPVPVSPLVAEVQPAATTPSAPAAVPVAQGLSDYLIAHQRYAASSAMAGVAPYVRTVSEDSGRR